MSATNMQLLELEDGLDELRNWVQYQRTLPINERAKLGKAFPTYLRTKRGWVITLRKLTTDKE